MVRAAGTVNRKVAVFGKAGYTGVQINKELLKVGLAPTFCLRPMYRQNPVLTEMLEPVVTALGYELLGIEHIKQGRHSLLRLYIDSEDGINIDDCTRVSEQVTGILDVKDPIKGAYNLEVSSPGFDRPLFTLDQFRRFLGHRAKVVLRDKIANRRKLSGEIVAVGEDDVEIAEDGAHHLIPADSIERAHLVA